MKTKNLLPLALCCLLSGGMAYGKQEVRLGNDKFVYVLSTEGNRICVSSYFDRQAGRELLYRGAGEPLFEFNLNDRIVRATDPVWEYKGSTFRSMANDGTEVTSVFEGTGPVKGLELSLDHQYFPGFTLVRERMRLRAGGKAKMSLSNLDGKNHFVYPQYVFADNVLIDGEIDELRMASYNMEVLKDIDRNHTYDDRSKTNLGGSHMFHTNFISHPQSVGTDLWMKGPFAVIPLSGAKIVTSYEHASQDLSVIRERTSGNGNAFQVDASQGVEGEMNYTPTDDDYWFIGTRVRQQPGRCVVSQNIMRGGYLDGEAIPADGYYETAWSTVNIVPAGEDHLAAIKHYILYQITEHKASRKAHFYYNTWGMQRDARTEGLDMREVFNQERILEEIDYAAEMNVDLIVLDDGWQETMGVWTPNSKRLGSDIGVLVERMESYGITPGIWISLLGIDSTSTRYRQHPDWVVKDAVGKPVLAQWDQPTFDLVSGFYDLLLEDHKYLIDLGFRFFKWDAINTLHSYTSGLHHGDESYSKRERIDRYNYLMPFYVVRLMRELREYNPEVVIEVDLTEPERAMVGLMPLQEGIFFWMNNGASAYGDYSTYRTKSMRNIINQTGDLLPPEVLKYAAYPHNIPPFYAQRYNINTILVAGRGTWGNLRRMTQAERKAAGILIAKSKLVQPYILGQPLQKKGVIGNSPEIYQQVNSQEAFGQVIGFSGSPLEYTQHTQLYTRNLLGVLNHAYRAGDDAVEFDFQFTMPDDTREAFILGNQGSGVSILGASGWLDEIKQQGTSLTVRTGAGGVMNVRLPDGFENLRTTSKYDLEDGLVRIEYQANETIEINWN